MQNQTLGLEERWASGIHQRRLLPNIFLLNDDQLATQEYADSKISDEPYEILDH
jgi:hypothetical protein